MALDDVTTHVRAGEFVCVLGPSGCGKSTLLNMIAGLFGPTTGTILHNGSPLPQPNVGVGYVTQADHLFPWRTVRRNIGLGLELQRHSKQEIAAAVDRVIDLVGLTGFADVYPSQLSGGMRKRVSLARTLVLEPTLILADEPFASLDAQLRVHMRSELLRIWRSVDRRTVVFVTHDIDEAITLADRIIVLTGSPGRVKADLRVDIPRPRDALRVRFDEVYAELFDKIWGLLEASGPDGHEATERAQR